MKLSKQIMKPQDVVVLLKIIATDNQDWLQVTLAQSLKMSQSEISQAVARARYSGLMDENGKDVMRQSFMDFLQYGLSVVFPARPGAMVRGMPTAHSVSPLNQMIESSEIYVWPWAKGETRGQGIAPLYGTLPEAVLNDSKFYELIALVDTLRIGRVRERNLAIEILKERIC